jgi:hypothetical protein
VTFSYNLVLALFLLAPGFAAFAGLFHSSHQVRHIHPAPPAPNSILILAFVTLSALGLHAGWAGLLVIQDVWAAHVGYLPVPFEPNAYLVVLQTGHALEAGQSVGGGAVAVVLLTLAGLSLAGYALTVGLVRTFEPVLRPYLYGWAADLVGQLNAEEPGYLRMVTAFVLTDIAHEEAMFGYEGLLSNMTLGPDKEISSISLEKVSAFYVVLKPSQFKRVLLPRPKAIPNLYLAKEQIRNVSFTVYRMKDEVEEDVEDVA